MSRCEPVTTNIKERVLTDFADIPQSGGFFKPEEHKEDFAILIEPQRFEAERPTNYGPRDTIWADVTYFRRPEDLESGNAVEESNVGIDKTLLARDLRPLVGKAVIATTKKINLKNGNTGWVWNAVPADVKSQVVEWVRKRDAEREAVRETMPDFLA